MKLSNLQQKIVNAPEDHVLVISSAGSGKAQPNSTIIPTSLGLLTIGDLEVGDLVFGRRGQLEKVTQIFPQGHKKVVEVKFEDGRITECCEEHLWTVTESPNSQSFVTLTTRQMADTKKTYYVPNLAAPLSYPFQASLPIDPYQYGVTLCGDIISDDYVTAPIGARQQVLAGLMNGKLKCDNGHIAAGTSLKFAQSIADFARSLTYYASIIEDDGYYEVSIENPRPVTKIVEINETDRETEMTCIMVGDNEHLYVTNSYIITHNTTCLTERFRRLYRSGVLPSQMVLITFTNAAAEEISERLGRPQGLFIGTIHSYANYLLRCKGIDTSTVLDEEDFDQLFELVRTHPECIKPVEVLMLDEGQDSTPEQLEFLFDYVRPRTWTVFADWRQSIYRYAGATPDTLIEMSKDDNVTVYQLNINYRCANNILEFAKGIIDSAGDEYYDNSICGAPYQGFTYIDNYTKFMLGKILDRVKPTKDFKNWFILTRTNRQLNEVAELLRTMKIPYSTFKRAEITAVEFNQLMDANTIKLLTIHGCIPGNTLIQTSNGIKTIKEVVERSDYSELVYDGEKYSKVKRFIDNGKEKVYKITTQYGNTIEVTKNHEVCILTENGIEKRKAEELKGDEELLLCKDIPDTSHQVALQHMEHSNLDVRTVIYNEPDYLTEDLAELIGLITADGSYNTSSIHYIKCYKECCDRFAELIFKIFGKELKVIKDRRGSPAYVCECNSKFILEFLKLNFDGITPCNKFISSKILEGDKNIYRAFLRGLFEDGTVRIKKQQFDHICLTFKNDKMKEQLQTMLFNLGIDCVFKKYDCQRNINNLQIYAGGGEEFKKIGFISPIKQKNLEKCQQKYKRKNKSRSLCQLILHYKDKLHFKKNQFSNLLRDGAITEYSMEQLVSNNETAFREDPKLHMAGQIFSKYQVEQIMDISLSEEEVDTYCLEMEDKHEFIQNGFLMGNSKGLEADNVIVIGARQYDLEEKCISYVAATRAKRKLFWLNRKF